MKKAFLSFTTATLVAAMLTSCDNTKKTEPTTDSTSVKGDTTLKTTVTKTETVKSDKPTFSNEDVNKGLAEYAQLKEAYIAALKSQNKTQVEALTSRYTTWAENAAAWSSKLKAEEVQKYSDYLTKLSNDWSAAAQQAVELK